MSCHEFDGLLDAYFDGELPVPEALSTERHLSQCAVCRGRYEALEWLRSEMRGARLDYTPPAALVRRIRARGGESRRAWVWSGVGLAAAVAALLLLPRLTVSPERSGGQILDSHLRSLLSASLVDVTSSDRHTVKPWFQGRIGFSPSVPDLAPEGFVLLGGRLEVINQQRAAALVYKRREHVINLFIAEDGDAPKRSSHAQGYHLISWHDRGLSYWAVSDLNAEELSHFTQLVRSRQ